MSKHRLSGTARVFCGMRTVECGKLSRGNLRKIKCERSANYLLPLLRIPQPKNSAFPQITKLPLERLISTALLKSRTSICQLLTIINTLLIKFAYVCADVYSLLELD